MSEKTSPNWLKQTPNLNSITIRLGDIEKSLKELHIKMDALMSSKKMTVDYAHEEKLDEEQEKLFDEIAQLGSDAEAMYSTEELLNEHLEGIKATKVLVIALKRLLKEKNRNWGIQCLECGEPATPIWTRNSVIHGHPISSGYARHASRTVFQKMKLMHRKVTPGRPPIKE